MQSMTGADDMMMQYPVDFTDPRRMLGASPALLQGKILRGGMGTGMPMWGSIFTEEQIWDLIAYLYSFQFEYQK
jgi:mono/diheme cytochrome c family protein